MNFDIAKLSELGIGAICILFFYFILRDMMKNTQEEAKARRDEQKQTNAVIQGNSKAINQLTNTLEKGNLLEEAFRREVLELTKATSENVKDVKEIVLDVQERMVQ